MKFWKLLPSATALVLFTNANASVINTIDGVEYEWLELTAMQGLSRNQVEAQIAVAGVNDELYGYEYASRSLVESLFLSYSPWPGFDAWWGNPTTVSGISALMNDFGVIGSAASNPTTTYSVDGYTVTYDSIRSLRGIYGTSSECSPNYVSCLANITMFEDSSSDDAMAWLDEAYGWDSNYISPLTYNDSYSSPDTSSFLVRTTVVPVPAAVWLFGSGLIGLASFARSKKA
ncbi:MAG: VPLPA-CTERM sorting domain-containing protein [Gammaproteobacteria bacterium]|nr:VPLPA-CTERM sorting domain-containing protein [Gammaproteobacteria bacterium]